MAAEKHYPPTEYRLKELRSEGIVPFSRDLLSFSLIVGLCLSLLIVWSDQGPKVQKFLQQSYQSTPENLTAFTAQGYLFGLKLCFILLLPILFLCILSSLIQTKFLFTPYRLGVDFGRFFSIWREVFRQFRKRFLVASLDVLKVILWFAVSFAMISSLLDQFPQVNAPGMTLMGEISILEEMGKSIFSITLFVMGIIALTSWALSLWVFRQEHSMSREDLEGEVKQTEISPEVRKALIERGRSQEEEG